MKNEKNGMASSPDSNPGEALSFHLQAKKGQTNPCRPQYRVGL